MLFGGMGHAAPMGGMGGGGIGLLDIIIIGALLYFLWKFMKRRRVQTAGTYYTDSYSQPSEDSYGRPQYGNDAYDQLQRGIQQIRQFDPSFNVEEFKETAQDMFFRIQAGWINRHLDDIENMLTQEMAAFFREHFVGMRRQGRINRLENIAVRKVEPTEAWQEEGREYITVLFTANLLDYTVDEKTGQVVEGDKLNPVKFQEYWTFCRDVGFPAWQLSAINPVDEPMARVH
jgi:predicted lipid-binding transport protein (Tim44 family)